MIGWWRNRRGQALLRRAQHAASNGNFDGAAHLASAAIVLMPDSADAHQQRGMWYHLAQLDTEALLDYDRAIRLAGDNPALYLERGRIRAHQGQHAAALLDFEAADRLQPHDPVIALARAQSLSSQDQLADAIAVLTVALNHHPAHSGLSMLRARLNAVQGHINPAIDDYTVALEHLQPRLQQAEAIYAQLPPAQQDARARELVSLLREEYWTLATQRGHLRLQQGDLPGALGDFETALATLPAAGGAALIGRGRVRARQNDVDAIDDFMAAIEGSPQQVSYYFDLADFLFQLNQYGRAYDAFADLSALPLADHGRLFAEVGLALCEHQLGEKRQAYNRWKRLMAIEPAVGDIDWLTAALLAHHPNLQRVAANLLLRLV